MLATLVTAVVSGLRGELVRVEVDVAPGLPVCHIVGLPDAALSEARERVRAAIRNSGFEYPLSRITINLAPADRRKFGAAYDLAIAVGILVASGQIRAGGGPWALLGELSLGGSLMPVPGVLPMVATLRRAGYRRVALPAANLAEARLVEGVEACGLEGLGDAARLVAGPRGRRAASAEARPQVRISNPAELNEAGPRAAHAQAGELVEGVEPVDLRDVRGQPSARWALEVALVGGHNLLLVGPPGAGKTLLARAIPALLPPLDDAEALEVSVIESVCGGLGPTGSLRRRRPFRAPHHTSYCVHHGWGVPWCHHDGTREAYTPMTPRPVAYLRRSSAGQANGNGRISFDVQRSQVLALAASRGDPEPELVVEWGVSGAAAIERANGGGGTGRGGRRRAWHELRAAIEAGQVSALYAYSLSRLARSTRELLELAEVCMAHSVPIRLAKEGDIDGNSPHGRLYLTVLAATATFEAEVAAERGRERTAAMRDRGQFIGRPPYGWLIDKPSGRLLPDPVAMPIVKRALRLYRDLKSPARVARALNNAGVPAPQGGQWMDGTVRRILARQPGAKPPETVRGSRALPVARFARLLNCSHCGYALTPSRKRYTTAAGEARTWTGYTCSGARYNPSHPRARTVAESVVLRWAREEAARLWLPDRLALQAKAEAARAELDARRARLIDALEAGAITRPEAEPRLAKITAEAAALVAETEIIDVPRLDWEASPETLNAVLRALWERIDLDEQLRPIRAEWRVPEWRAAA